MDLDESVWHPEQWKDQHSHPKENGLMAGGDRIAVNETVPVEPVFICVPVREQDDYRGDQRRQQKQNR